MARHIIIDNTSGFIMGDTANFNGRIAAANTPLTQCRELDQGILGEHGRTYEEVSRLASNETGYVVYRADVNGSDAVTTIRNGHDQEMIEAVKRDCVLVATVRCSRSDA